MIFDKLLFINDVIFSAPSPAPVKNGKNGTPKG